MFSLVWFFITPCLSSTLVLYVIKKKYCVLNIKFFNINEKIIMKKIQIQISKQPVLNFS